MKPIDIAPADLEIVQHILSQYVPSLEVWAFGSRVAWNARTTSDLDLILRTKKPLDFALKAELQETFAQSDLPFHVDIVDWAATSEDFQEVIAQEYVVISNVLSTKQKETGRLMETTLDNCTINETVYSPKTVWPSVEIGTIAQIEGGSTPSTRNPGNFGGDIAWITPKDMSTTQSRFLSEGARSLSSQGLENCSARLVPRGTVLLSTRAPIGLVAIARQELATNQGIRNLIPSQDVISEYLYYWLKANTAVLKQHAAGTTFSELSGAALKRIQLQLPPLPEQKSIAHILGTLDDKIELNHQMNQTLEEIVQALFKSWFIDFDPVTAKLEKRWQSKQFLSGLPAEIYDLFPDCLVESRLGKIPRGWAVQPLRECFRLKMGQSPPGNTYNKQGEGIPFFQGRTEFGFRFPENRKFCTKPIHFAVQGDTLVSVRAPVGDMNVAREQCCIGRGIAALRHRSGSSSFTYYYASLALQQELQQFDHTGTVFGSINKNRFEALNVIEPSSEIVNAFDTLAKPLDRKILINYSETKALISLKNILLPCLMSGRYSLL